jgi:hypothetical protein
MPRRHFLTVLVSLGTAVSVIACATPSTSSAPTAQPVGAASIPVTGPSAQAAKSCPDTNVVLLHQAPELEAVLPASVQGRPLARWSLRGRCWPELLLTGKAGGVDDFVKRFETPGGAPIDLDKLAYGVAGRSDTSTDPPYFVWVATRPLDEDEIGLALYLLLGGAGYYDVAAGVDMDNYKEQAISGKDVRVGTEGMLPQGEHQRGRPYLYQTEDYMFVVVTDDDAWAADAIGQLP